MVEPIAPSGLLPLLPLRSMALFPGSVLPIELGRNPSIEAVYRATQVPAQQPTHNLLVVGTQRDPMLERPRHDDLYGVATVGRLVQVLHGLPGRMTVLVQGISRVNLLGVTRVEGFLEAEYHEVLETVGDPSLALALSGTLLDLIKKYDGYQSNSNRNRSHREALSALLVERLPGKIADMAAAYVDLESEKRIELLQERHVSERLRKLIEILTKMINILEVKRDIDRTVRDHLHKHEHEIYLRHKARAIQAELGEEDYDDENWLEHLKLKVSEKSLPEEARSSAERELARLEHMSPQSSESNMVRSYVEWIVDLPWDTDSVPEDRIDLDESRKQLDTEHYGIEKVKRRIVEYLAVRKLAPDQPGPVLCLVGPPGVGKTTLARSIAETLSRKFSRISLGGVRDDAEIRGHRRTYIGALPGRIIQAMKRVGTCNPVILLDEIDKMSHDGVRGDPKSAILEALDSEQNSEFEDHYLNVPYDLSRVIFICTANVASAIPQVLRDRLELIQLSGYTLEEKLIIGSEYALPRVRQEHGLSDLQMKFPNDVLKMLIREYTREAGVRQLQRILAALLRDFAMKLADGVELPETLSDSLCRSILGPAPYRDELMGHKPRKGVATGLAWSPSGGQLTFVEVFAVPGDGQLRLTGSQGEVMKESGQAALSLVRSRHSRFSIPPDFMAKKDIHIHMPAGALAKDGPSAGIAIAAAIVSAITDQRIRHDIAMTGEITLTGKVLPVGGIREKVLAAHQAGIRQVILPDRNRKDEREIPKQARSEIRFHYVQDISEVLDLALLPATSHSQTQAPLPN